MGPSNSMFLSFGVVFSTSMIMGERVNHEFKLSFFVHQFLPGGLRFEEWCFCLPQKKLLSTTSLKAAEGCSLWNISHEPMGFCLHIFCIKPGTPGSLRFVVKNYHLEICLKRGTEKKHPPLTTNGEWKTKSGLLLNTRENPVQHNLLGNL